MSILKLSIISVAPPKSSTLLPKDLPSCLPIVKPSIVAELTHTAKMPATDKSLTW